MAGPMLSSYTKATARDIVKGDLGLRSNNLLQDGDIDRWMATAQGDAARVTGWFQKANQSIVTTADQALYDLPTDLLSIRAMRYLTLPIRLVTVEELDRMWWNWQQQGSGTPRYWYRRGFTQFGLFPMPSASGTTDLKMDYTAVPTGPAADADHYTIPTVLEEMLTSYAKFMASMKDSSGEGARRIDYYRKEWEEGLNDLRSLVRDGAERESIVLGADGESQEGVWWDPIYFATVPPP
jgi:hypothetical protein